MSDIIFTGFDAYRDHMSNTFRVEGKVRVKNGKLVPSLVKAEPQGIHPDHLLLRLVLTPDFGAGSGQSVRFDERWGDSEPQTYTSVTFLVEAPGFLGKIQGPETLPVRDVY